MEKLRNSLYGKMLILAVSLEVLLIVIALIGFTVVNIQNERDTFRKVETLLLKNYQNRHEFSLSRDIKQRRAFEENHNKIVTILNNSETKSKINILEIKVERYKKLYDEYTNKMTIRGLNEDSGLEGKFRVSVHNIEDIIKSINNYKLMMYMLQARRSEKDYIMRRHDKYITKVYSAVDKLITESENTNNSKMAHLQKLAKDYKYNFDQLVVVFQDLDNLENKLTQLEKSLEIEINNIVSEQDLLADNSQRIQYSAIGFTLLIGIFLSMFIARTIVKPVRMLQKAASSIAKGNYDTQVEVYTKDEVGTLATLFNSMAQNIKISNDTIIEQQKEVEIINTELSELTLDLQSSIDNISLLSEIGKSITTAITYDNIFNQLYKHLGSITQSSTFAIGLFDEAKETINYRLVISNSIRKDNYEVDMTQGNRLDVICMTFGQEIIIDDFDEKISDLSTYSEFIDEKAIEVMDPKTKSCFYLPISYNSKIIGLISIEDSKKQAFSGYQLEMLRNLASYIAIAIQNAISYEAIKRSNEVLKKTQKQLIQAEKMASLGQLTAGIAHEIKNPLNFIKNYAEGTVELWQDFLNDVKDNENNTHELIEEIADDITTYLETIQKNSSRIDNIIKSMMNHSRESAGYKEDTNIYNFLEDNVDLAYKGFRTQHNEFHVEIKNHSDNLNECIPILQQDFSRVITNIIDNSCYALMKKYAIEGDSFRPIIDVSSKSIGDNVEIRLRDNGTGIPKDKLDKIFNPFYTTKPTGEGTGLGLSLSFDVIQSHGGSLEVDSIIDEYTEFIIKLPKA